MKMKERWADFEMQTGRFKTFDSMDALIEDLHSPLFGVLYCPYCNQIRYPDSATSICSCMDNR